MRYLICALLIASPLYCQTVNPPAGGGGGATFPATNGLVQNTSTTTSTTATPNQVVTALAGATNGSAASAAAVGAPYFSSTSTQVNPRNFVQQYDTTSGISYNPQNQYSYNFDAQYLPHLEACLARVRANTGDCRVLIRGDSTFYGAFSNGTTSGDFISNNIPVRLAQLLSSSGTIATSDSFIGGDTAGQGPGSGNDPRITLGSWAPVGVNSIGGNLLQAASGTTPLVFTPTGPFDTCKVWYPVSSGLGSFSIAIDSGTPTTVSGAGASGFAGTVVTAATGYGYHRVVVTPVSGGPFMTGVECYSTTHHAIRLLLSGWSASKSSDWVDSSVGYSPLPAFVAMAPDVDFLDLDINDWGGSLGAATHKANYQTFVTSDKANGIDTIFITGNASQASTTAVATQQTYIQADYENALANNVPLVDQWSRWGSYSGSTYVGGYETKNPSPFLLYYDSLHPNASGYADLATAISIPLLKVVGPGNTFTNPQTVAAFSIRSSVSTNTTPGATPAITLANGDYQSFTLSANATPTVTGIAAGGVVAMQICQPATGGPFTWTWPSSFHGGSVIGSTANTCTQQTFRSFNGTSMEAMAAAITGVAP
jgi:hypothetical protein